MFCWSVWILCLDITVKQASLCLCLCLFVCLFVPNNENVLCLYGCLIYVYVCLFIEFHRETVIAHA